VVWGGEGGGGGRGGGGEREKRRGACVCAREWRMCVHVYL